MLTRQGSPWQPPIPIDASASMTSSPGRSWRRQQVRASKYVDARPFLPASAPHPLHILSFYIPFAGHAEVVTSCFITRDFSKLITAAGDSCIFVYRMPEQLVGCFPAPSLSNSHRPIPLFLGVASSRLAFPACSYSPHLPCPVCVALFPSPFSSHLFPLSLPLSFASSVHDNRSHIASKVEGCAVTQTVDSRARMAQIAPQSLPVPESPTSARKAEELRESKREKLLSQTLETEAQVV